MQSIGARIFLFYWFTVIAVITVSNAIAPERLRRPELIRQAIQNSLSLNGQTVTRAYESGGCAAAAAAMPALNQEIYVATSSGQVLCGNLSEQGLQAFIRRVQATDRALSKRYRTYQLVGVPLQTDSGRRYVVLLRSPFTSSLEIFGWLPGFTTFAISGVITIGLTFFFARPIRKLRFAARQVATGNLKARVQWGSRSLTRFDKRGEIQGLIYDFNDMASRLQALVDAQRLLLRDISHELRSPLTRLSVALELTRTKADASLQPHLDRIEREANRLNNLIGQLMSLSYMETIHEIEPKHVSLHKLMTDLLPDIRFESAAQKCHVTATIMSDCIVRGDPELLHRAVENVIRNAIRYTPENGVVQIDLETDTYQGERYALLRVADTGPGVPADELEAILRPFYRVDKSRQAATGGFGIGLAIADRVLHLHDGEIIARNRPGGGLVVEMYVPLTRTA